MSARPLLDLARAGVLWTGAQHEDRHRPIDPRAVRWQERSNYRRLETTMKDPAAEIRRQLDDLASTIPPGWADDVIEAAADGLDASRYPAPRTARAALAAERAAVVAWLRRPVEEEEARAWLVKAGRASSNLEPRFNGGDVCWTSSGRIVAYDRDIARTRWQEADAIERGEHLTGGEVTR